MNNTSRSSDRFNSHAQWLVFNHCRDTIYEIEQRLDEGHEVGARFRDLELWEKALIEWQDVREKVCAYRATGPDGRTGLDWDRLMDWLYPMPPLGGQS